ncbi:putative DNA-directed RNA polymerases I and III subunit RPAC2 [Caenorhabditis elegans]|uniref:Probable DNA-directed RNA polymerases I and III subunit RPAC2 n=1 Tax=Caenorhabditis elegans TaxID=6239 RepID=RPAC2_CAEEL|nr:putative DNA-directed RNA polymerases I and III subunit RPAC2 [Caenorhabditis elegans]P34476.1 RecName: Full=Probable DNA-directed RNA polymerases I and III subunit RPAC2; Short=RNA polymerases I and III subunit AC2; AltName: Full=AC19; AltName: Full=DNA-directed RNA polymerase I subunit D [Caenorhabditis elegans]CAA80165.1 Probable DNA-directed RNA polymerases I and III subunit RPAC2 [Caenorhabditis elegans]|eukprot:NP_499132.1 Probable DNA-directed RNA polymerases I and III subunit RPAC2 [Caenorhabditis elegans]
MGKKNEKIVEEAEKVEAETMEVDEQPQETPQVDDEEDLNVPSKKKMEILDPKSFEQDPSNLTLIMYEEDHTIGNSIKHILSRMDEVEFCGYNVPHPLEDKILFRVQTKDGINALEVLAKAFESVEQIFSTIRGKFEESYEQSQS